MPNEMLRVIFVDAAQGDWTLIFFPEGQVWMVDCGSTKGIDSIRGERSRDGAAYVGGIFQELIKTQFRGKRMEGDKYIIDVLVLTHPDKDHYNLVPYAQKFFKFNDIIYGGPKEGYGFKDAALFLENAHSPDNAFNWIPSGVSEKDKGPTGFYYGGAKVTFLAANCLLARTLGNIEDPTTDNNKNSIVLLIETGYGEGKCRVFLMADASFSVEEAIFICFSREILQPKDGDITVLKAGHHGSANSSHEDWLKTISPNFIAISCGTQGFNGTRMPAEDTINRLISNSNLFPLGDGAEHTILCWKNQNELVLRGTKDAIYTTTYGREYSESTYFEEGGSIHFILSQDDQFDFVEIGTTEPIKPARIGDAGLLAEIEPEAAFR